MITDTSIEQISVDELTPYARNSRTHSEGQLAQVAASIREFGFTNPILIDGEGGIIAGHGRLLAARELGMKTVPCIRLDYLTEAQKKAYIIADNKLALNAGWNNELLALEINDLKEMDFDVDLLGFTADELAALNPQGTEGLTDEDAVPDVPENPVTVLGDVWVCGAHRVMCGSTLEIDAWDTLMAGEKADACWTDPPYNVAYGGAKGNAANKNKVDGGNRNTREILNDDMGDEQFSQFLLDAYIGMYSVLKSGAPIYVAHSDTEGLNFRRSFIKAGFKLSGCLIWRKNSLVLGRSDYQWMHEPILYGWKPGSAHRWCGGRKLTTIVESGESSPFTKLDDGRWQVKVGDAVMVITGDAQVEERPASIFFHEKPKRSAEHPTMKPVGLIEKMLKASARPGDIVIDGFGGSGSTMIAADRLGMSSRLMELDPKYCDVIVKRWQEFTGRQAILESTSEPFPLPA
ncbi:MAG: site-specific DNA-methyltransferase [Burkholderiaceae bacterium]